MVIIGKQFRTRGDYVGIAKELLWNKSLLVRLDNYYTYPYKELSFHEWGLVNERNNRLISRTYLSKELCLSAHPDFVILKEDTEYYYGTFNGETAYIRLLPTKDHFQNMYYFGKHLGVYDSFLSLLNRLEKWSPYIYKNQLWYRQYNESHKVYYLNDYNINPVGLRLDYLIETDITIYPSIKDSLEDLPAEVLYINCQPQHFVSRWQKPDGEQLIIKWNR